MVATACRTRQDVEMLVRDATLPPIVTGDLERASSSASQNMPVSIADIICFDTRTSSATVEAPKQRLLTWVSFWRNPDNRCEDLEFYLPKKVTTRFVSVVFIESENYLELDG